MGGCLCLPFPAQQPAGFSPSRGLLLVLSLPSLLSPPLSLVIFQSRHPSLPPPHPPLIALSGHPPCLFRWNRRGNESQSPLLTHSWDFAPLLCAFLLFFHLVRSTLLMMICIRGGSRRVGSFRARYGGEK